MIHNLKHDADCSDSSWWGTTLLTSVEQLRIALGDPETISNDGDDKINYEWVKAIRIDTLDKEIVFTVYDWKTYRPISEVEAIDWHIGGKSKEETEMVKKMIRDAMPIRRPKK